MGASDTAANEDDPSDFKGETTRILDRLESLVGNLAPICKEWTPREETDRDWLTDEVLGSRLIHPSEDLKGLVESLRGIANSLECLSVVAEVVDPGHT